MVRRLLRALAAAGLLVGLWAVAAGQTHAADREASCRDVAVPVTIGAGQPAGYQIWGQLCTPASTPAAVVQVLVHGLNYSHLYWDFPFQSERYSYVRWANRAGYATFNLDRIGVGRSSHPPTGR